MSDRLRYLQPVAEVLAPAISAAPESLVPCSSHEIDELAALVAPHKLPAAYVEFLRFGGKQLAGVFRGVDFSYRMALTIRANGNRDILKMLRLWDPAAELPAGLFVLNEHLGSNFTYFDLNAGDDPPVYLWEEGEGGLDTAVREHEHFSGFVLAQAQNAMKLGRR